MKDNVTPDAASAKSYRGPSMSVVGLVDDLTQGPNTPTAESYGFQASALRQEPPSEDDGRP